MYSTITAPVPTRIAPRLAVLPVWRVGALAAIAASVATEAYGLVARAAGVPMYAGDPGATKAVPLNVGAFAIGTVLCTFVGTVLAVILVRRATQPARTFARTAVVLTVVSFVSPAFAGDTVLSTKLMLAVAHVLAAAIVIPALTYRLAHTERTR
jgi:uncharacterized protein DUF6069